MENQILEAISHIRNISKKKVTIDRIVAQIRLLQTGKVMFKRNDSQGYYQ